eukprot:scpid25928/ scgid24391/ 
MKRLPLSLEKNPCLRKMALAEPIAVEPEVVKVDILIGSDFYYDIIGTDHVQLDDGLILLDTKLGLIPTGRVGQDRDPDARVFMVDAGDLAASDFDLRKFWSLEEIGIKDEVDLPVDKDHAVLREFEDKVQFVNGRYVVHWPWKDSGEMENLPENFELSFGHLKSLVNRISKTPEVLQKHDDTIRDQLAAGIIEEIADGDDDDNPNQRHYIPHHCVVKPDSRTTKIRVVYDASAKVRPDVPSLNNCLHSGPPLLPDLCGILIRFRLNPIAITSDVEKAFLQIGFAMPDREFTRFLWVVSSPFLLAATVNHHLKTASSDVAADIQQNMYVDNHISGTDTVTSAVHHYEQGKQLFEQASMNLREWSSNSNEFMQSIPEKDKASTATAKVLGMQWHTGQRDVQFYDPLGLFSPIITRAKLLIQEVWKRDIGWDDPLPPDIMERWRPIATDLHKASNVQVPRYVGDQRQQASQRELHVFCDASNGAYGAAAYLRTIGDKDSSPSVHLIYSKSRISPIKAMTTPRLELLAALIGTRMVKFLKNQLPFPLTEVHLWSDSQCVLGWIEGRNKIRPTFVENHLREIRQDSTIQFRYVRTRENPADLPSRGTTTGNIEDNQLWWNGPDWLSSSTASWPPPIKPETETTEATEITAAVAEGPSENIPPPFGMNPSETIESLSKLLRITAYAVRFVNRKSVKNQQQLATSEITNARNIWVKYVQEKHNREMERNAKQLDPFTDDNGILRCGG